MQAKAVLFVLALAVGSAVAAVAEAKGSAVKQDPRNETGTGRHRPPIDDGSDDGSYFRPPSVPFITVAPMTQKYIDTEWAQQAGRTKYWDFLGGAANHFSPMPIVVAVRINTHLFPLIGALETQVNNHTDGLMVAQHGMPVVDPTTTTFHYRVTKDGALIARIHVHSIHTMLPDNLDIISRPLAYINTTYTPENGPGRAATVSFYMGLDAYNVIHLNEKRKTAENVTWEVKTGRRAKWARLGTQEQPVLGSFGDAFMLNWGYAYLGAPEALNPTVSAGYAHSELQFFFAKTGGLPSENPEKPRPAINRRNEGISIAVAVEATGHASGGSSTVPFFMSYDDIFIQYYFGRNMTSLWKLKPNGRGANATTMEDLIDDATDQCTTLVAQCWALDAKLTAEWTRRVSKRYSKIASLAYRQAFAAIEYTKNAEFGDEHWIFLKEISTGGDVNTMDVIWPACPLYLWTNPRILKALLLPILTYANNGTWHPFTQPFSPHQLGFYPISNITTAGQEVMPMENTGNMIFMLLAYAQRTNDTFFYPRFWPMLTSWVDYLTSTQLPDPPFQITTDDFAGPLRHDVNLAIKGIIAVHAFGELCDMVKEKGCDKYRQLAKNYTVYWNKHAIEYDADTGLSYTKLAYDQPRTFSTKYNLIWQQFLGLGNAPFDNYEALAANETKLYLIRNNYYGFPLDPRHSYQKPDWMTWAACLSNDLPTFNRLFDGYYRMANTTWFRAPLIDIYDTHTGTGWASGFYARPVVGAIFAPLMLNFTK